MKNFFSHEDIFSDENMLSDEIFFLDEIFFFCYNIVSPRGNNMVGAEWKFFEIRTLQIALK